MFYSETHNDSPLEMQNGYFPDLTFGIRGETIDFSVPKPSLPPVAAFAQITEPRGCLQSPVPV